MALAENSTLITTATKFAVANNGVNDVYSDVETGTSADQAVAYVFSAGNTGDDRLESFNHNDSVVNYQAIFDGNNDGIINFGANGVLDIDRVNRRQAGADQITVGSNQEIQNLRFLGSKDGGFVYADYRTYTQLDATTSKTLAESTVNNDTFSAGDGDKVFLFDTALGLNLGADTITDFGVGDELVTTTAIHNGPDAGALVTFGRNGVLDLPGDTNGIKGDIGPVEGGQIEFGANLRLSLLATEEGANGATYYHYGLLGA